MSNMSSNSGRDLSGAPWCKRSRTDEPHWDRTAYVTVLWGTEIDYQVEALLLGMCLQRTSTKRRILFLAEDSMQFGLVNMLAVVWEIRPIEFLQLRNLGTSGASWPLQKVWTKLRVWDLLAGEFEVVVMLDSDLLIVGSPDSVFNCVQYASVAGCFRGLGDFSLTEPRRPVTIKTKRGCRRAGGRKAGGGINGGVVVLKPDRVTFQEMINDLNGGYVPPDQTGGEQNFISEFFGLRCKLQQLDLSFNFQIHQLGLIAGADSISGRWSSLARRFETISVFHFSTRPKPVHLLLGQISERTCDHLWKNFQRAGDDRYLNNSEECLQDRIHRLSDVVFDYYDQRFHLERKQAAWKDHGDLFRETARRSTTLWFHVFFDQVWPTFLQHIIQCLMDAAQSEGNGLCYFCGQQWSRISCGQHVLFTCPFVQGCAMKSFRLYGPGSRMDIECDKVSWFRIVCTIGSNPFQIVTGLSMCVKMAYLDCVLKEYKHYLPHGIDLATYRDRHRVVQHCCWRNVLNTYKKDARSHNFGRMEP